jgi:hypothetical protein
MSLGTLFETAQVAAPIAAKAEPYAWWNSLRHHRLLLSGTALHQCFAGNFIKYSFVLHMLMILINMECNRQNYKILQ